MNIIKMRRIVFFIFLFFTVGTIRSYYIYDEDREMQTDQVRGLELGSETVS